MKQPTFLLVIKGGCLQDVVDLDNKDRTYAVLDLDADDQTIDTWASSGEVPKYVYEERPEWQPGPEYDYRRLCGKLADAFGTECYDSYDDDDISVIKMNPIWVPLNTEETEHIFAICDNGTLLYKSEGGATCLTDYNDLEPNTLHRLTELLNSIRYE